MKLIAKTVKRVAIYGLTAAFVFLCGKTQAQNIDFMNLQGSYVFLETGTATYVNQGNDAGVNSITTGGTTDNFQRLILNAAVPGQEKAPYSCISSGSDMLQVFPILYPDIDTVIRLSSPNTSQAGKASRATYTWIPTAIDNKTTLLLYFCFVVQQPGHTWQENPSFQVDLLNQNNQYITGSRATSSFLVNPEGTNGPNPDAAPPTAPQMYTCNNSGTTVWTQWFPIAFDLWEAAQLSQTVKLRITARGCQPSAHWAYGYYHAKMIQGHYIETDLCSHADSIALKIPEGFQNIRWYAGPDSSAANLTLLSMNNQSITHPIFAIDTSKTYFRCIMESPSGIPFMYEAFVDYYYLQPNFSYTQDFTDSTVYKINFTDVSTVTHPAQNVVWEFGDGTTSTTRNPTHIYAQAGDYEVKFILYDNNGCGKYIRKNITIFPDESVVVEIGEVSAIISWTAVDDAAYYILVVYGDSAASQEVARFRVDANGSIIGNAKAGYSLACTIDDLVPSNYYYWLTAFNEDDEPLTTFTGSFAIASEVSLNTVSLQHIQLYPNPVRAELKIKNLDTKTPTNLQIADMMGRVVANYKIQITNGETVVNVASLPAGSYIVKIGDFSAKIVKE